MRKSRPFERAVNDAEGFSFFPKESREGQLFSGRVREGHEKKPPQGVWANRAARGGKWSSCDIQTTLGLHGGGGEIGDGTVKASSEGRRLTNGRRGHREHALR